MRNLFEDGWREEALYRAFGFRPAFLLNETPVRKGRRNEVVQLSPFGPCWMRTPVPAPADRENFVAHLHEAGHLYHVALHPFRSYFGSRLRCEAAALVPVIVLKGRLTSGLAHLRPVLRNYAEGWRTSKDPVIARAWRIAVLTCVKEGYDTPRAVRAIMQMKDLPD